MHVREMFDVTGSVAIMTSASSGLEVWLSRGLAEERTDVVLAARSVEKLESVASELRGLGVRALPVRPGDTRHQQAITRLTRCWPTPAS